MDKQSPAPTSKPWSAIGYNVGQTLLGGTAPLVGTAMVHGTGDELAPAYYLVAAGAVSAVASLFIRVRHERPPGQVA